MQSKIVEQIRCSSSQNTADNANIECRICMTAGTRKKEYAIKIMRRTEFVCFAWAAEDSIASIAGLYIIYISYIYNADNNIQFKPSRKPQQSKDHATMAIVYGKDGVFQFNAKDYMLEWNTNTQLYVMYSYVRLYVIYHEAWTMRENHLYICL